MRFRWGGLLLERRGCHGCGGVSFRAFDERAVEALHSCAVVVLPRSLCVALLGVYLMSCRCDVLGDGVGV